MFPVRRNDHVDDGGGAAEWVALPTGDCANAGIAPASAQTNRAQGIVR